MAKRPSFQFYPADERSDLALQSCSLAARGLWQGMICLMHESPLYGHLILGSDPMAIPEISRAVGAPVSEVTKLLRELESRRVFSRLDNGTIYSRRMVRDEHLRTVRAAAGARGAAVTHAPRLPARLPSALPETLPEQNGGLPEQNAGQNLGSRTRARAPSSSSSSLTTHSTPVSSLESGLPGVPAIAVASLPPNGNHPSDVADKIEREKRKLLQLASTGPPNDESD